MNRTFAGSVAGSVACSLVALASIIACAVSWAPAVAFAQPPGVGARGPLAPEVDPPPLDDEAQGTPQSVGSERAVSPGVTAVTAPGVTAPGVTAPGVTAPGVTVPGVTAPGATAPGVTAPRAPPATTSATEVDDGLDLLELRLVEAVQHQADLAAEERARAAADAAALAEAARDTRERESAARNVLAAAQAAADQATAAAERAAARARAAGDEVSEPTVLVASGDDVLSSELEGLLDGFGQDRSLGTLILLLLGITFAAAFSVVVQRARERLQAHGVLPAALAFVHLASRLLVVALTIAFVARFLPPRLSIVLLLAFGGLAVAVGWSARDLLPDLIAGLVLAFERRVRPGMWLSGETFAGQVERVGLRSSSLRDARGCELSVPNRLILGTPLATDTHREREQDVTLRIDAGPSAEQIRESITDAVLSSPWAAPGHRPIVFRDPDEPWLWRVRAKLLEPRFGVRFEGELLERTEAVLAVSLAEVDHQKLSGDSTTDGSD